MDEEEEPFGGLAGFRLNAPAQNRVSLSRRGELRSVSTADGEIAAVSGFRDEDRVVLFYEGQAYEFNLLVRGTGATHGAHDGEIEAPMPGKVTAVEVSKDERVANGQRLLTVEAMKMEHALTAPFDGTVAELNATVGAQVKEGELLVRIDPEPSDD